MSHTRLGALMLALSLIVRPLPSQFAEAGRAGLAPPVGRQAAPSGPLLVGSRAEPHASYWLEGGLVTGIGLLVAVMPWLLDGDGSVPVKVARAGFMVGIGFAPGALIGGLIPKQRGGAQVSGMSGLERR